jgi:hypothetical protein
LDAEVRAFIYHITRRFSAIDGLALLLGTTLDFGSGEGGVQGIVLTFIDENQMSLLIRNSNE